jgi:demethylmenaquinone methyltransferase/2-methoxy-6-polyprenyl-1,4-benzoquinol methylase
VSVLRWPADPAEAVRRGLRNFDRVAPRYDLMRALISGGREAAWKRATLLDALSAPPRRCLDVATGTGDMAALLLATFPAARVVGVDGNRAMLARARRKIREPGARWLLADLNRLPVAGGGFDVVTVAYGLRYAVDLPAFLRACRASLRAGGVFWSFDLGRPASRALAALWTAYLFGVGTLLGVFLHARPATYWHLVETLRAYPGQRRVAELLREAGFENVRVVELLGGVLAVHVARSPGERVTTLLSRF